jgi:hypothetical protein
MPEFVDATAVDTKPGRRQRCFLSLLEWCSRERDQGTLSRHDIVREGRNGFLLYSEARLDDEHGCAMVARIHRSSRCTLTEAWRG